MHTLLESRPQPGSMASDGSAPERASMEAQLILAIEDDSALQRVLKRLFETEGYSVELARMDFRVWSAFARGGLLRSSSICACRTSRGKKFASKSHELLPACPLLC